MRLLLALLIAGSLLGCSKKTPPPPTSENQNPFKNVMPKKVGDQVEKIQKEEEERNDRRIEQMKE